MNPLLLNKPELIYELKLRGTQITTSSTADELRQQLSSILESSPTESISQSPYSSEQDIDEIERSLSLISSRIATLHLSNTHREKIATYLIHLQHRIDRVDITTECTKNTLDTF